MPRSKGFKICIRKDPSPAHFPPNAISMCVYPGRRWCYAYFLRKSLYVIQRFGSSLALNVSFLPEIEKKGFRGRNWDWEAFKLKPFDMKFNGFLHPSTNLINRPPCSNAPRKVRSIGRETR